MGFRCARQLNFASDAERVRDILDRGDRLGHGIRPKIPGRDGNAEILAAVVQNRGRGSMAGQRRPDRIGHSLHRIIGEREVRDGASKGAKMIEAGGEGEGAGGGSRPSVRLQPEHAAERRRYADRAVGIGSDRNRDEAARDRNFADPLDDILLSARVGGSSRWPAVAIFPVKPEADSFMWSAPTSTAPAASSRAATVASFPAGGQDSY